MEIEAKPLIATNLYWSSLIVSIRGSTSRCRDAKIFHNFILVGRCCRILRRCCVISDRHSQDTTTERARLLAVGWVQRNLQRTRPGSYWISTDCRTIFLHLRVHQIVSKSAHNQRPGTVCSHGCSVMWRDRGMSNPRSRGNRKATKAGADGQSWSFIARSSETSIQTRRIMQRTLSRLRTDNIP